MPEKSLLLHDESSPADPQVAARRLTGTMKVHESGMKSGLPMIEWTLPAEDGSMRTFHISAELFCSAAKSIADRYPNVLGQNTAPPEETAPRTIFSERPPVIWTADYGRRMNRPVVAFSVDLPDGRTVTAEVTVETWCRVAEAAKLKYPVRLKDL
jgi:hypothetical protein